MPGSIGSRSPSAPDQGVCAISPSDLVGYVGNLMNTVNDLKQRVAELEAKNTETNQLSNISGQVGWVTGVTYMGIPGWTQTEYGTLIPPEGFTLSQLGFTMTNACTGEETPYQGVVMDADGVLQFGWTPVGDMCGAKVETWDAGGAQATPDAYAYEFQAGLSPNPYTYSRNITEISNTATTSGSDEVGRTIVVELSQTGIYAVNVNAMYTLASTSGTFAVTANSLIKAGSNSPLYDNRGSFKDFSVLYQTDGNSLTYNTGFASPLWYHTARTLFITSSSSRISIFEGNEKWGTGTIGDRHTNALSISVVRIGSIS